MKTSPLKKGALTENSTGIGTVTRKMVRERAVELAIINGHSPHEVSQSDWEQAKRELTGEPETDPKEAILESAPESDRWNLVAQQPFFKGMSDHLIQLLADSIMEMQFKPGDWIYRQGDPANRFYLILEGKVMIESEVKERGMIPIRTLGPGDDLGWAWLFSPHYMHFSACAIEPTRTIFFYGTRLREKCEANHELGYQLMKRVAEVVVRNLNATQQRLLECPGTGNLLT